DYINRYWRNAAFRLYKGHSLLGDDKRWRVRLAEQYMNFVHKHMYRGLAVTGAVGATLFFLERLLNPEHAAASESHKEVMKHASPLIVACGMSMIGLGVHTAAEKYFDQTWERRREARDKLEEESDLPTGMKNRIEEYLVRGNANSIR